MSSRGNCAVLPHLTGSERVLAGERSAHVHRHDGHDDARDEPWRQRHVGQANSIHLESSPTRPDGGTVGKQARETRREAQRAVAAEAPPRVEHRRRQRPYWIVGGVVILGAVISVQKARSLSTVPSSRRGTWKSGAVRAWGLCCETLQVSERATSAMPWPHDASGPAGR